MMESAPQPNPGLEQGLSLTRPHRKLAAKGANGINFICMRSWMCASVCVCVFGFSLNAPVC